MNTLSYFAPVLATYRERAGLSREDLARQCGISKMHLEHLEQGYVEPSLTTLFRLSKALHVMPGDMVNDMFCELEQTCLPLPDDM